VSEPTITEAWERISVRADELIEAFRDAQDVSQAGFYSTREEDRRAAYRALAGYISELESRASEWEKLAMVRADSILALCNEADRLRAELAAAWAEVAAWRAQLARCTCDPDSMTSGRWCPSCLAGLTALMLRDGNLVAYPEKGRTEGDAEEPRT